MNCKLSRLNSFHFQQLKIKTHKKCHISNNTHYQCHSYNHCIPEHMENKQTCNSTNSKHIGSIVWQVSIKGCINELLFCPEEESQCHILVLLIISANTLTKGCCYTNLSALCPFCST